MKKLIYSQEDLDLILSLETETKDKEIERLKEENIKLKKLLESFRKLGERKIEEQLVKGVDKE